VPRRRLLQIAAGVAAVAAVVIAALALRSDDGTDVAATGTTSTTAATLTTTTTEGAGSASSSTSTSDTTGSTTSSSTSRPGPSTTVPPVTTRPPATTLPAPPFESSIAAVSAEQLGASWRPGCPLGVEQLRAVEVSHWGVDGAVHRGRLIVDGAHAERMVAAFRDLYAARFPIQQMVPIDRYGGDDQASMRANNTSAFNCRYVSGTTSWSEHAYGRAIDVNPLVNPYVKGTSVDPPEGAPYADRSRTDPGMIHAGDAAVRAFAAQGWAWGGSWSNGKDYQHFSASGR
jgi:hypothetical protein